ncbi:MAG: glutamate 5-kinase, partial [Spirochaetia bacterium]
MKILIKAGSALISRNNRIDYFWMADKVKEISALHAAGHEVTIVSSGAVAAGMEVCGISERPKDTLELQLLSGIGQTRLIKYYKDLFKMKDIFISQVLLTHHNFASVKEEQTIIEILNTYMQRGMVPIINENDLINKEELEGTGYFSDNDILAALVACNLKVDLAILLTDVDGLYQLDPKQVADVNLLEEIHEIDEEIRGMVSNGKSRLGLGGMQSKLKAAEMVTKAGIDTIVANGNYDVRKI